MRSAINNQIEVIEDIEAALTVASSVDKIEMLSRAKREAMQTLTTLRYINQ